MTRRWSPPGRGWIRVTDSGAYATWMRPEPTGVGIAVYTADAFGWSDDPAIAEVWVASVPRGSWQPHNVWDKAHRIRWSRDCNTPQHGALRLRHWKVPASHRLHRRGRYGRGVSLDSLPRSVERALGKLVPHELGGQVVTAAPGPGLLSGPASTSC